MAGRIHRSSPWRSSRARVRAQDFQVFSLETATRWALDRGKLPGFHIPLFFLDPISPKARKASCFQVAEELCEKTYAAPGT